MLPLPEEDIDALSVAYLAAAGRTQIDIARILGLSQSAVSRLYTRVKETYIRTTFCEEKLDADTIQRIRRRTSRLDVEGKLADLARKYGNEGPVVHSIFLREGSTLGEQFDQFSRDAAPVVMGLVKRVRRTVGVAWGSTLWQTTQQLRSVVEAPRRPNEQIDFVPLCGEPLGDILNAQQYADRTSSRIAIEMSRIINGDDRRTMSLGLVPAFIPRTFDKAAREAINNLIDLVPYYGRIFGPRGGSKGSERPLAEDLDMILTAAGDSEHPVGFGKGPLLQLEAEEADELRHHIYGDIGGVLISKFDPQTKKPTPGQKLVKELAGLWTGLRLDHLRLCARQAFADGGHSAGKPGVALLGFRESLAELVIQAVQQGLVNHLIIGSNLEAAIEKMLGV